MRIQRTAICGSDLHIWHGPDLPLGGFSLGHEFMGIVEETGPAVRSIRPGDRVLVACTTGCGNCSMCNRDLYSACEVTTAQAPLSNVFGNPLLQGGQAEAARVPFADTNLFRIPESISDAQALFLTDILPTGWLGAELANVRPGDSVVVFGCGPVGTFAQRAAEIRGASRIFAVDLDEGRLAKARARGYDTIQPEQEPLGAVSYTHLTLPTNREV